MNITKTYFQPNSIIWMQDFSIFFFRFFSGVCPNSGDNDRRFYKYGFALRYHIAKESSWIWRALRQTILHIICPLTHFVYIDTSHAYTYIAWKLLQLTHNNICIHESCMNIVMLTRFFDPWVLSRISGRYTSMLFALYSRWWSRLKTDVLRMTLHNNWKKYEHHICFSFLLCHCFLLTKQTTHSKTETLMLNVFIYQYV